VFIEEMEDTVEGVIDRGGSHRRARAYAHLSQSQVLGPSTTIYLQSTNLPTKSTIQRDT
jgi:hypothetical protein